MVKYTKIGFPSRTALRRALSYEVNHGGPSEGFIRANPVSARVTRASKDNIVIEERLRIALFLSPGILPLGLRVVFSTVFPLRVQLFSRQKDVENAGTMSPLHGHA